ncbi:synaptic vesicle 2-related protein isoform X2 [Papio anubis]|uniref:synaptic vesicle 2-related protein isoform X2 n=1 Tax=Papio anubis TaxID=9555 RepID=UPI0012AD6DCE|nr:synaptic vesicle 2-related protein isoform X2 [Papio anubis]
MEEDLFQLRQLPVVKFRRTGESARSEDDTASGEHEVQIEGVRMGLEAVELDDGAAVPKEFANPTDDTFMVEDAVEAIGFGKFQWKLSVLTGLAWMADAMEMMILSILAPQLHCEWRLPSWQVALLTSVVFVGMMSSSTLWGNISDQYGRKTGLKISVLWTLYYGILSAFAPVYSWILVLRGLVGFGIGGVPQSVTLYAEFLPMKARAKCILLIEVFWAIGTVFEVVLAVFVMPSLGWRWLLILSAVPLLLFAVLCFWLPESARYDVLSGNQEKAIATLKRIATENGAPMPLGKLIISRQEDRGKMRDLFTPHFRWTTLLLWFIWFSNAFSYYGLVLLTTELFQAGDVCSSLPHGNAGPRPGHLQWHGKSGCSHHSVHCPGDAGILCVPDSGSLQWLLPPGCPGLLLFAHRDQRQRTAGVQPPGMGPGDGRPRNARCRCYQVELWLSGIVTDGGLCWSLRLQSSGGWQAPTGALIVTADIKNSPKSTTWTNKVLCLESVCSSSLRSTQGWGDTCSRGFSVYVVKGLFMTCGSTWENYPY